MGPFRHEALRAIRKYFKVCVAQTDIAAYSRKRSGFVLVLARRKPIAVSVALIILFAVTRAPGILTAQATSDELVVITSVKSDMERLALESVTGKFKEWYKNQGQNISIRIIQIEMESLLPTIGAWAGEPNATILWGASPDLIDALVSKDLIEQYEIPDFDKYPPDLAGNKLKDTGGHFYAFSLSGLGIVWYGTMSHVSPPQRWDDLLDQRYKGNITLTTPSESGLMHHLVELLLQQKGAADGWIYWRKLVKNVEKWSSGSLGVYQCVVQEDPVIGVALTEAFALRGMLAGEDVHYKYLDTNTMIPSLIAILKGAPNIEVAKKFVEYITSKEGQKELAKRGYIPVSEEVKFSELASESLEAELMRNITGFDNVWEIESKLRGLDFAKQTERYNEVDKKFNRLKQAWLTFKEAEADLSKLEGQGFDVTAARTTLREAEKEFDKGNYDEAKELAKGASAQAIASAINATISSATNATDKEIKSLNVKLDQRLRELEALFYPTLIIAMVALVVALASLFLVLRRYRSIEELLTASAGDMVAE